MPLPARQQAGSTGAPQAWYMLATMARHIHRPGRSSQRHLLAWIHLCSTHGLPQRLWARAHNSVCQAAKSAWQPRRAHQALALEAPNNSPHMHGPGGSAAAPALTTCTQGRAPSAVTWHSPATHGMQLWRHGQVYTQEKAIRVLLFCSHGSQRAAGVSKRSQTQSSPAGAGAVCALPCKQ